MIYAQHLGIVLGIFIILTIGIIEWYKSGRKTDLLTFLILMPFGSIYKMLYDMGIVRIDVIQIQSTQNTIKTPFITTTINNLLGIGTNAGRLYDHTDTKLLKNGGGSE